MNPINSFRFSTDENETSRSTMAIMSSLVGSSSASSHGVVPDFLYVPGLIIVLLLLASSKLDVLVGDLAFEAGFIEVVEDFFIPVGG